MWHGEIRRDGGGGGKHNHDKLFMGKSGNIKEGVACASAPAGGAGLDKMDWGG